MDYVPTGYMEVTNYESYWIMILALILIVHIILVRLRIAEFAGRLYDNEW